MHIKLRKFIASILAFVLSISVVGFKEISRIYAYESNKSKIDRIVLTNNELTTYKGLDIAKHQYDMTKMNEKERDLYNILLEKEYERQESSLDKQGVSKEEFINELKMILGNDYLVKQDSMIKYKAKGKKKATRLISVGALGSALNIVITATLIATGVGSIGELVKKLGKQGAKKWVKKHLSSKIVSVLTRVGAKTLGKWIGSFVVSIIDTYLDPGTFLAKKFDSVDIVPNSGYIELW